jgi:hypothetical protein
MRNFFLNKKIESNSTNVYLFLGFIVFIGFWFKLTSGFSNFSPEILSTQVPDDLFYYLKISQNIAENFQSSFTGGILTNGYHPLWCFSLAFFLKVFNFSKNQFPFFAIILSQLFFFFSAVILYFIFVKKQIKKSLSLFLSFIYFINPWSFSLASTGLETGLFMLLFNYFWYQIECLDRKNNFKWALLGIISGFLMLCRTDSVFFVFFAYIWIVKIHTSNIKKIFTACFCAAIILIPWLTWSYLNFGTFIQSSAEAISVFLFYFQKFNFIQSIYFGFHWMNVIFSQIVMYPLFVFDHYMATNLYCSIAMIVFFLGSILPLITSNTITRPVPYYFLFASICLCIFYFFIRRFVQVWHVVLFVNFIVIIFAYYNLHWFPKIKNFFLLLLILPIFFLPNNGLFAPQKGAINAAVNFFDSEKNTLKIGHTDSGFTGYFSRHIVINLDGIVNNQALSYIKKQKMLDYLVSENFDYVVMEPDRFNIYTANNLTEDISFGNLRKQIYINDSIECFIDSQSDSKVNSLRYLSIKGWILNKTVNSLSSFPIIQLTDNKGKKFIYKGSRVYRPDVQSEFRSLKFQYAGFNFSIPYQGIITIKKIHLGLMNGQGKIELCATEKYL